MCRWGEGGIKGWMKKSSEKSSHLVWHVVPCSYTSMQPPNNHWSCVNTCIMQGGRPEERVVGSNLLWAMIGKSSNVWVKCFTDSLWCKASCCWSSSSSEESCVHMRHHVSGIYHVYRLCLPPVYRSLMHPGNPDKDQTYNSLAFSCPCTPFYQTAFLSHIELGHIRPVVWVCTAILVTLQSPFSSAL